MTLQHPVVCEQIGERPVYLGSARSASEGVVETEFSHVITLGSYEQPLTTEFIPLVDGPEIEYSQFKRAVVTVREHYRQGSPTLVHCEVGISRSAAVIATALAAEEETTFEEAVMEIQHHRKRASPRGPLQECAKRYLRQEEGTRRHVSPA